MQWHRSGNRRRNNLVVCDPCAGHDPTGVDESSGGSRPVAMTCGQNLSPGTVWRSMTMQAASDLADRFAFTPSPSRHQWRSGTMRTLDAAVTPGTVENTAVTFAVTVILIPWIPNRALAMVAGIAAGSILGR